MGSNIQNKGLKNMGKIKKVLFAAGGTGGHVFPAIAVADAMRTVDPDVEIAFVGATHGNESTWVGNAGYRFILLDIDFIKGASVWRKLRNLAAIPGCLRKARQILHEETPDLVIGAGGYVSGPLVFEATRIGIRTAILEQNAIPGLTNKILSKRVDTIYISFEHTKNLPAKKTVYLGNPVRQIARTQSSQMQEDKSPSTSWQTSCLGNPLSSDGTPMHILVFGGSQGAMKLNTDVPKALAALDKAYLERIAVWHQAGKNKCRETEEAYKTAQIEAKTTEFIDDMGSAYRWADLLICRAGATSIAEIKAAGKASILVPFPFAAHNHQEKNADEMVAIGASVKVLNDDVASKLPDILIDLIQNPQKIENMEHAALADARPNAAEDIARHCLHVPN